MEVADHEFLEAGMRYVLTSSNLKIALTNLVRSAVHAVGSTSGSLYLLNRSTKRLEPFILINLPDEYLAGCQTVELGKQCCGRAALHKMPWIVEDMWSDPLFADCREAAKKSGMRSGFSIPVMNAKDECLGTLGSQFQELFTPTLYDLERQRLFAQLISFAIARHESVQSATIPASRKNFGEGLLPSNAAD